MKKILICIGMILLLCGCNNNEVDSFEHYDLQGKDLNIYNYYSDDRGEEMYVLADITPESYETILTGLFLKIADNDYILLETLEFNETNSYYKSNVYQFYDNKLYGVGNGDSPMIFEIELNGTKSKIKELEFQMNGKNNPFLITAIEEITEDMILYFGYSSIDDENITSNIKCSIETKECNVILNNIE